MFIRRLDARTDGHYEIEFNGKIISNITTKVVAINKPGILFPGLIQILLKNRDGSWVMAYYDDPEGGEYSLPKKGWRFGLVRWKPMVESSS